MTATPNLDGPSDSMAPQAEHSPEGNLAPDRSRRPYAAFRRGAIAVLILGCALFLSLNLVDPDLWGHIKYGQELLANGHLPLVATHTFSVQGYPWINHENLAEIALAIGYTKIGPIGLLIAKCLLGMAIVGGMVLVARWHAVGTLVAWATALLVSMNLTAFFPIRPQLFSFVWCALMLVFLDRAFVRWHRRQIRFVWLWAVPPLMVLWVNSHGGFVAGLCIFVAYLMGRSIELLRSRRRVPAASDLAIGSEPESDRSIEQIADRTLDRRERQESRNALASDPGDSDIEPPVSREYESIPGCRRRKVWHMATIATMACLAILVNPYGIELPRWLVYSLGQSRPEITEWAAPRPSDPVFFPFVVLAIVAAAAMLYGRRRRDWTQIAILALVGFQAAMHLRHIAFFAILCGFWLPPYVALLVKRFRPDPANQPAQYILAPWIQRTASVLLAGIVLVQGYTLTTRLTQLPVHRDRYPVDAFAFMVDRQLNGKLVVAFNWAQYAIAAFAPDVQVQCDGRFRTCYPQEVVDSHFDFLLGMHHGKRHRSRKSGAIDGTRAISQGEPDLVLIDRQFQHAVDVMERERNRPDSPWTLLYQDGIAQLWGRRSRFDHPSCQDYLPPESRFLTDQAPKGFVYWPALPPAAMDRLLAKH
ncbi:MAG: hypothetical protein JW829_06960 [Pirellulales bacterium]|nr:hypothetical protein [Pirellulales bacterium]